MGLTSEEVYSALSCIWQSSRETRRGILKARGNLKGRIPPTEMHDLLSRLVDEGCVERLTIPHPKAKFARLGLKLYQYRRSPSGFFYTREE